METQFIIQELTRNKHVFSALLKGLTGQEVVWKPAPEKWCLLEIVCHLYDEEREDFRARTQFVFDTPHAEMPKLNPPVWVTERNYMGQDYNKMLDAFLAERDHSITWLTGLKNPPWDNAFIHYKMGPLRPSLFLNNWVAHDYLHIRQITKLKYDYHKAHTSDPMDYAGEWN